MRGTQKKPISIKLINGVLLSSRMLEKLEKLISGRGDVYLTLESNHWQALKCVPRCQNRLGGLDVEKANNITM